MWIRPQLCWGGDGGGHWSSDGYHPAVKSCLFCSGSPKIVGSGKELKQKKREIYLLPSCAAGERDEPELLVTDN